MPEVLNVPFRVRSSDVSPILEALRKLDFWSRISIAITPCTESSKSDWELVFSCTDKETLLSLATVLSGIIQKVWYGHDFTQGMIGRSS